MCGLYIDGEVKRDKYVSSIWGGMHQMRRTEKVAGGVHEGEIIAETPSTLLTLMEMNKKVMTLGLK